MGEQSEKKSIAAMTGQFANAKPGDQVYDIIYGLGFVTRNFAGKVTASFDKLPPKEMTFDLAGFLVAFGPHGRRRLYWRPVIISTEGPDERIPMKRRRKFYAGVIRIKNNCVPTLGTLQETKKEAQECLKHYLKDYDEKTNNLFPPIATIFIDYYD